MSTNDKDDKDLHPGNEAVNVDVLPDGNSGPTDYGDALRVIELPESKWLRIFRSVKFQMFLLGVLSFSGPSMSDGECPYAAIEADF
jgi:hypothetical protein